MIPTTLDSEDVYLLPYPADWSSAPVLTPSMQADALRSEGGIERRQAYASTTVSEFSFSLQLTGDEGAQFRVGLQAVGDKRILCPFWPSVQSASALVAPAFTTGLWLIAQEDISEWEINDTGIASEFTPGDGAFRVPLMVGNFSKPPDPDADTSVDFACKIQFKEAGDAAFALTPTDSDGTPGPSLPTGDTPKIFPLAPNWAANPQAGGATVEVTRSQIGFGREPASIFYPQTASRPIKLGFTAETPAQAAALMSFFSKRQSLVEAFWLPGALNECALTAATDGVSAVLHVNDVESLGDNEWISLIKIVDNSIEVRKISSRDVGAKTITLTVAPAAHATSDVRIVSAVLARYKKPSFSLSFVTPGVVDASISFVEVPTEYDNIAGETTGVTQGALPRVAFLYRFTRNYPGGSVVNRFTSFDIPVTIGGTEVFEKDKTIKIEHGPEINDTLDPDRTVVPITSRVFVGNPLLLLLPNQLEGPLYLEILECQPDATGAADTATNRFYGRVRRPQFVGPTIKAEVAHILSDLGRNVPRYTIQNTCNYRLFGQACGKVEADFTDSVEITAVSGNLLTVTMGTDRVADYFGFGRVFVGSGATYQSRSIYASTEVFGGETVLTIESPFNSPVDVGDTVNVSPGCDKLGTTCDTKFDNYIRHGGAPWTPPGNPSLVKVVQNQTQGGKK